MGVLSLDECCNLTLHGRIKMLYGCRDGRDDGAAELFWGWVIMTYCVRRTSENRELPIEGLSSDMGTAVARMRPLRSAPAARDFFARFYEWSVACSSSGMFLVYRRRLSFNYQTDTVQLLPEHSILAATVL